jgi:hypothetical protein
MLLTIYLVMRIEEMRWNHRGGALFTVLFCICSRYVGDVQTVAQTVHHLVMRLETKLPDDLAP